MPPNHVIYCEKPATNTHTDCTQTHTRIAHKHTHGLTQTHTYFYRLSFSPLKHGRKHTHTWNEHRFFFRMGAPATINIFAFLALSGRPRHRKIRYFWHPGRTFTTKTHTHIGPGGFLAIKKWPVLPPGAFQPLKMACFASWSVSDIKKSPVLPPLTFHV